MSFRKREVRQNIIQARFRINDLSFDNNLIHLLYIFREHVNLVGLLDYEIWKASHMLAEKLPQDKDNESQEEE